MAIDSGRALVIAEAGVNHNGELGLAMRLAEVAAECGADVVKFQMFRAADLVTAGAAKATYQDEAVGGAPSQREMLERLELSPADFLRLKEHCDGLGVEFLATAFDAASLRFLAEEVGQRMFKVPSGDLTDYPGLVQTAAYGRPVVMSTGMATMEEVGASVAVLRERGAGEVTLLHCNTQYPTPYADVNLRAMQALGEAFGCPCGYSDHTPGIEVSIAAVAMGASVVEKHFTLDKGMEGPDHRASLDPVELAAMVESIRNVEAALGDGEKRVTASEAGNRVPARRSIVAARDIVRGEVLTEKSVTTKRPGTGLSPMLWPEVLGTRAVRDFWPDELIEL